MKCSNMFMKEHEIDNFFMFLQLTLHIQCCFNAIHFILFCKFTVTLPYIIIWYTLLYTMIPLIFFHKFNLIYLVKLGLKKVSLSNMFPFHSLTRCTICTWNACNTTAKWFIWYNFLVPFLSAFSVLSSQFSVLSSQLCSNPKWISHLDVFEVK